MDAKILLKVLGVSKNDLSLEGKKNLEELSSIAETLEINTKEVNLEIAVIEKILEHEAGIKKYNTEVLLLHKIQNTLKESFVLLKNIENLQQNPLSTDAQSIENTKSLVFQEKELKSKIETYKNSLYSEDIDHRNLVRLSIECENTLKELIILQEKNELYGDFPVV